MGHGGKFQETRIPLGPVVEAYAAIGNLDDAVKRCESAVDALGQDPNNSQAWKDLEVNTERVKSRSITLVTILRKLRKSQEK